MENNAIAKQEIEKFDGTFDYVLWRMKMAALLGNLVLKKQWMVKTKCHPHIQMKIKRPF